MTRPMPWMIHDSDQTVQNPVYRERRVAGPSSFPIGLVGGE